MHVDLSWWKTCTSCSTCFPAPPSRGLWVLLVRPELVSAFHVWSWMVQESTHMWYLPWTLWRPLHVKKSIPVTSPILVVWFNLYLIFSRIDNCNNAHSGCIAGFVFLMLQETNRLYQWATPKSRGWSSIVPLKLPVTKPTAGVLARWHESLSAEGSDPNTAGILRFCASHASEKSPQQSRSTTGSLGSAHHWPTHWKS